MLNPARAAYGLIGVYSNSIGAFLVPASSETQRAYVYSLSQRVIGMRSCPQSCLLQSESHDVLCFVPTTISAREHVLACVYSNTMGSLPALRYASCRVLKHDYH